MPQWAAGQNVSTQLFLHLYLYDKILIYFLFLFFLFSHLVICLNSVCSVKVLFMVFFFFLILYNNNAVLILILYISIILSTRVSKANFVSINTNYLIHVLVLSDIIMFEFLYFLCLHRGYQQVYPAYSLKLQFHNVQALSVRNRLNKCDIHCNMYRHLHRFLEKSMKWQLIENVMCLSNRYLRFITHSVLS